MRIRSLYFAIVAALAATIALAGAAPTGALDNALLVKGEIPLDEALSAGGVAAMFGPSEGNNNPQPGYHDNGRGGNSFVNDPCLAPPSPGTAGPVQGGEEGAVLNTAGSMGKKMIAGYNDSYGFYNDKEGLSGFA